MDAEVPEADVLVVGSGPAGLSAAIALRGLGVARVVVLEREDTPGGIPRHCAHPPYGLREFGRLMTGPTYARRLVAQARAAGVEIRAATSVTALHPGGVVAVTSDAGPATWHARAVLLATGVREGTRAARLIGGTRPGGVTSTGALQGMVHLAGVAPFRRPAILGTEMVAFSAILTCRAHAIRPVAMIEPGPRTVARWPAAALPRALGIPVHYATTVAAIEGGARVTGVVLDTPSGRRRIAADGLIVSGGFRPEASLLAGSHLARDPATGGPEVDAHGRLSDPAYFAAGNLLHPVETAGWCWHEGRRIAQSIARGLRGALPPPGQGRILLSGPLAYATPLRLSDPAGAALDRLILRMARPARGRLSLRVAGHEVAGRSLSARPERRLFLPLPPADGRAVSVVFDEGAG
ncbi:NAD(P)/FAD-dependent oxidoreductase [Rhodobaculum claviforme]|uniref:Pyridine nucleotide-disulfide oxidoreductase n=1 Tax=Rhodobaculum claviforme TaxID=1549854 RepID=A0A934WJ04_9RHOB|nr:FAD-dependent oxidoreductase [Rhodobaculum claviforme]MBK5927344.1 pyridine nucleotide-disulfide oxidoreductase [Rhodobaculum claviforme]